MIKIVFSILVTIFAHSAYAASFVYVPEKFSAKSARVLVVIHGCLQTPESMALGTGFNRKADQNNLVVIYPQVPSGSNPIDCWSWYEPENQTALSGQLLSVRKEIQSWKKRLNIENAPVFATGISSGAATVAGLLACFPNDFAGGAIHSGPSYGLASNLKDGDEALKHGLNHAPATRACNPRDFKKPLLVIQGSADAVVKPVNVQTIVSDFLSHASRSAVETGEANGLKYAIDSYQANGRVVGRIVRVEGLGHAWGGYAENLRHTSLLGPSGKIPTSLPFFSTQGPNSTSLILDFFNSIE